MTFKRNTGFTLIEVMLVIVIIGILVAMVAPNFTGSSQKARTTAARADIESNLAVALDLFEFDVGRYPTTQEGLEGLIRSVGDSNWDGPYLKKKELPEDPWGRPYVYVSPGTVNTDSYDLSSLGPDGTESGDDIMNWKGAE